MLKYTEGDIKKFTETCDAKLLGADKFRLMQEMEKLGWKPGTTPNSALSSKGKTILINRSEPFEPVSLIKNWHNIKIKEEDKRSLALTEINPADIRFEHMLRSGETRITGKERIRRLKQAGHIRLDANIFRTFRRCQYLVPATNSYTDYIHFDGTILQFPDGNLFVLCLYRGNGRWCWSYHWLVDRCCPASPSAVLMI